jgi:hypothetical protein
MTNVQTRVDAFIAQAVLTAFTNFATRAIPGSSAPVCAGPTGDPTLRLLHSGELGGVYNVHLYAYRVREEADGTQVLDARELPSISETPDSWIREFRNLQEYIDGASESLISFGPYDYVVAVVPFSM